MAVYVSNIVIEQGFSFESTFQLEDTRTGNFLDLSGYDVKSQIRKSYYSILLLKFDFFCFRFGVVCPCT